MIYKTEEERQIEKKENSNSLSNDEHDTSNGLQTRCMQCGQRWYNCGHFYWNQSINQLKGKSGADLT